MDLTTLQYGPFAEGFIRVSHSVDEAGKTKFDGGMEVLSRHHDSQKIDTATGLPRLATHAIESTLMELAENKKASKLVEIPIRMYFDKPVNAVKASYVAYDRNNVPVCRGNGNKSKKVTASDDGTVSIEVDQPCTGNDSCPYVVRGEVVCRRQVVMPVQVVGQDNALSVFEVRTSSHNSLKALRGQLEQVAKRFNGLRHVPLKLQIWQASNPSSEYEAFDLFKLALDAKSEVEAMRQCKKDRGEEEEVGLVGGLDETFEQVNVDALDPNLSPSFDQMADFYVVGKQSGGRSGRREGTISAAQGILANTKTNDGAVSAFDAIKKSVKDAAPKQGTESSE